MFLVEIFPQSALVSLKGTQTDLGTALMVLGRARAGCFCPHHQSLHLQTDLFCQKRLKPFFLEALAFQFHCRQCQHGQVSNRIECYNLYFLRIRNLVMIFTKTGWSVFREFKASRHDLESLNMMPFLKFDVLMIFRAKNSPQASGCKD